MTFTISLYAALCIFAGGILCKTYNWFRISVGIHGQDTSPGQRLLSALKGILSMLTSKKIINLGRAFFFDVLLQNRLLQASAYRWASHMLVFWGFTLLLVMHALEAVIMEPLISDYASTQNPYLFLRNLGGLFVLLGLAMMIFREHLTVPAKTKRSGADIAILVFLGVMLVSGIFLEGTKITSKTRFLEMVEDYSDEDDPRAIKALEYYWARYYGLASDTDFPKDDSRLLETGKDIHEMSCASCHARPQWAFMSYGFSKLLRPIARDLDRAGGTIFLWYMHFLTAFAALALFPFTKFLHLLATPLSLLANAVMDESSSDPANIATKQAIELDACTHCGLCTEVCSVEMAFRAIPNPNIFPSEKIQKLRSMAVGGNTSHQDAADMLQGLYLCTNCHRCTDICPSGINLQSLWFYVREAYLLKIPEPLVLTFFSFYRGIKQELLGPDRFHRPLKAVRKALNASLDTGIGTTQTIELNEIDRQKKNLLSKSLRGSSLSYCFTCTTCSSACPVTRVVDDAPGELGLVPHQIIRAVNLGLVDIVFRSEMLWSCLGCYLCQDACPQGVRVADILAELKLMAANQVKGHLQKRGEKEDLE